MNRILDVGEEVPRLRTPCEMVLPQLVPGYVAKTDRYVPVELVLFEPVISLLGRAPEVGPVH